MNMNTSNSLLSAELGGGFHSLSPDTKHRRDNARFHGCELQRREKGKNDSGYKAPCTEVS